MAYFTNQRRFQGTKVVSATYYGSDVDLEGNPPANLPLESNYK